MNCLEIRFNNKTYRLKNDDQSLEGFYNPSKDWKVVMSFLSNGVLPKGWYFDGDAPSVEVFWDFIVNEIKEKKVGDCSQFHFVINEKDTEDDIINKLIGNHSFDECKPKYKRGKFSSSDVLVIPGATTNNWYGINENRCVLITGDKTWATFPNNIKNETILNIYESIKEGDKIIIDKIEKLFTEVFGKSKLNVFQKMHRLVNEKINEFCYAFYNPYSHNIGKNLNIDNDTNWQGKAISLNKSFNEWFIITNIVDGKYFGKKISIKKEKVTEDGKTITNIVSSVEDYSLDKISKSSHVNNIFTIDDNMLIGKYWFDKNFKILNINEQVNLFDSFFQLKGKESIDLRSKQITINDINDIFNPGTMVVTKYGQYIKGDDGIWRNNNMEISEEDNYKIEFITFDNPDNEVDAENIRKFILQNVEIKEKISDQELRIFLYDIFEDNVEIEVNYNFNSYISIIRDNHLGSNKPIVKVVIGKNGWDNSEETMNQIKLAKIYFEYITNENPDLEYLDKVGYNFKGLKKYVNNDNNKTVNEVFELIKDRFLNEEQLAPIQEVIEENSFIASRQLLNKDVDSLIKKLIDLGLYIHKCSL